LSAEFEAAIAAAHSARPGVTVIGSVRDVPEPPGKPARLAEAADRLRRFHRLLLVHGDADFLDLSVSWPLPADLLGRVVHTGYIGSPTVSPVARTEEVLVSVGGGVLGRPLLALAAQAAMLSDRPWRLLTGGADAAEVAAALAVDFKRPGLTIEPPRADYRRLLAGAACSVSLAGYNTVMDLAACDTPAILVPFEAFGEREQRLRADRLAGMPGVRVLSGRSMSPKDLARAVAEAAAGPRRPVLGLTRDGAARAAEIMIRTVQENA
jgi:predicted glycosyltransferase